MEAQSQDRKVVWVVVKALHENPTLPCGLAFRLFHQTTLFEIAVSALIAVYTKKIIRRANASSTQIYFNIQFMTNFGLMVKTIFPLVIKCGQKFSDVTLPRLPTVS